MLYLRSEKEGAGVKTIWEWMPVRFVREMVELYFEKHVSRAAAELAYFLILSFFPLLICVNAFVGLLDLDVGAILVAADSVFPDESMAVLAEYLDYISQNQSSALLIAGVMMALFAGSAAFRGLMTVMEELYGRQSYQGVWQIVASVVFSVLLLATIYLSIVVLLTGEWLFHLLMDFFHLSSFSLPWEWQWMRFLLFFCLLLLFVLLVYRMAAPKGKPRPPVLTGAVLASAAIVGASALFSWFIGMSSRYSLIYGSLASLIILLVWLYLCGNIIILGNVFNCVWYRHKKMKYLQKLKRERE